MGLPLRIEAGDEVFVDDSEDIVGHVRRANVREVFIFVEDKGDFVLPRDAVKAAANGQVVLICKKLPVRMRACIGHLHGEAYNEDED
jgi:Predicted kinase related to dihydroxyacetone kinase